MNLFSLFTPKKSYEEKILNLMKTFGLRTISLSNYDKWLNNGTKHRVCSVRVNPATKEVKFYIKNNEKRNECGEEITLTKTELADLYLEITNLLNKKIPHEVKRNILVTLNR